MLPDATDSELPDARTLVALEYDFLKHLTTLSLLATGGGVTFAGSIFAQVPEKGDLWIAAALFGAAGVAAFSAQEALFASLRRKRPKPRYVKAMRTLGTFGLGAAPASS